MGRIVGIDFGTRRIGIAATDPLQIIVTGIGTFSNVEVFKFLKGYCETESVEKFVVGDPFPDGVYSKSLKEKLDLFVKTLNKLFPEISIEMHDESLSSVQSVEIIKQSGLKRKKRRNKDLVDKVSAVLILQDFLGHLQ